MTSQTTSFRLAVLNLSRRRLPTTITIIFIAVAIGCSSILLRLNRISENRFSSLGRGGDAIVAAKAGGLAALLGALNAEGPYPGFLPYNLFLSLRSQVAVKFEDGALARPSVRSIIPFLYFGKFGDYRVVGTDESFINRPDGVLPMEKGSWFNGANEAVLGSAVAEQRGLGIGEDLSVSTWSGSTSEPSAVIRVKVVGILAATHSVWDRELYTDISTAQKALAPSLSASSARSIWGSHVLNYFLVYLHPGGMAGLTSLVNGRTVGQALSIEEERAELATLTGTGTKLAFTVVVIVLLLSTLAVTAMLVTRFEAMALQLAVLRAIGYRKLRIAGWLLWEGFLLGLAGCIGGIMLDAIGLPIVRQTLGSALPPATIVPASLWWSAPIWLAALLATTASVYIPLYRLYRQDVHFSLRD